MNNLKINNKESIKNFSRREFLKTTSLAGIVLSFSSSGMASTKNLFLQAFQKQTVGSGFNIFSIAVIDDAVYLALNSKGINQTVKDSLPSDFNVPLLGSNDPHPGNTARLASILPFNKEDYISLLANARENKDKLDNFGEEKQKLGFALGWVVSHAANNHLNHFKSEENATTENSIYCDAAILRAKSADKTQSVKAEDMRSLFHQMAPRIFTRFHTFIPDFDDGEGWVLRIAEWRENLMSYFDQLAVAYSNPDPEKVEKYVTAPEFYNPEDKVLNLVNSMDLKGEDKTFEVEQALKAEARSHYAQAIIQGYKYLKVASDFMDGKINEKQVREKI